MGLSVTVRVSLRDGTHHEDIGYGSIDNCKGKAMAFEKCKKEGTTDGMKRALRNFGNVLGNCLYDKTFLKEVSKVKLGPVKFDPDELHRRPEHSLPANHPKMQQKMKSNAMPAPAMSRRSSIVKAMSPSDIIYTSDVTPAVGDLTTGEEYGDDGIFDGVEFEDRIGGVDEFDVDGTFDQFTPDDIVQSANKTSNYTAPSEFSNKPMPQPEQQPTGFQQKLTNNGPHHNNRPAVVQRPSNYGQKAQASHQHQNQQTRQISPIPVPPRPPPPQYQGLAADTNVHPEITGAYDLPPDFQPSFMNPRTLIAPNTAPEPFDPKLESPLISKTSTIDHTKSTPIRRPPTAHGNSPHDTGSPLRRMAHNALGGAGGFNNQGMARGPGGFRAPSKLNPGKRSSDVLIEQNAGQINEQKVNENTASVGSAEKKLKN